MSHSSYHIFDRKKVQKHRHRSAKQFSGCQFLKKFAGTLMLEKLQDVNKEFSTLLDLGCHTGEFAKIVQKNYHKAEIICCDISEAMISMVPRHASRMVMVVDEECLPFAPDSFEVVASCLTFHWINDLPGTLSQIHHILRSEGIFIAALLGGDTLQELRHALYHAENEVRQGVSARISPFIDVKNAGMLLQRCGFKHGVSDSQKIVVNYPSLDALLHDLRYMGECASMQTPTLPLTRKILEKTAMLYQTHFGNEAGLFPATFDIIMMTAYK